MKKLLIILLIVAAVAIFSGFAYANKERSCCSEEDNVKKECCMEKEADVEATNIPDCCGE